MVLLQIVALVSLAVTLPLLEVLGRGPEFFIAHRLEGTDLAVFVLVVAGAVPAVAVLVAWLAGRVSRGLRVWVAAAMRVLLSAAVALQAIRGLPLPGVALVVTALAVGVAVDAGCRRLPSVRLFVALLSPAVIVAPAIFCLWSPASRLLARPQNAFFGGEARKASVPVVFLVFDQLPLSSLLDADGGIDRAAYPNFAALARTATWFRQTSSVSDRTEFALPAILTGRYPRPGQVPTASGHPENLFTGLAPAYGLHVEEPLTRLCPSWLCPDETPLRGRLAGAVADSALVYLHRLLPADLARALPEVRQDWAGFWHRTVQARWVQERRGDRRPYDWINAIDRSSARPVLHFLHVLLPHEPFVYLPTGQLYSLRGELPGLLRDEVWVADEGVVAHNYQRHLLQVGAADHFLGLVFDRLKRLGMFDETLIVVTSDHGASFHAGRHYKRPDEVSYADIMSVPFFLKLPGQHAASVSDRPTETVDIVPTITSALHADHRGRPEGRSALDEPTGRVRTVRMFYDRARASFATTTDRLAAATMESARRKIAMFGPGPAWLPRMYLAPQLAGRPVTAFPVADDPLIGVWVQTPEVYEDVDPPGPFVPSLIRGDARQRAPITGEVLAVAVNGTIVATSPVGTWQTRSQQRGSWWVVVPPECFRPGANDVALYQVETSKQGGGLTLRRTSTAAAGSRGR